MSERRVQLARKLAETWHLSVSERAELPGGSIRLSDLVSAVGEILAESGWYPADWRPDQPYDGILIEARADGFVLHEKREIGVQRYSPVSSKPASSLAAAVHAAIEFAGEIDGIGIDWRN